jgi:hypothetical protein
VAWAPCRCDGGSVGYHFEIVLLFINDALITLEVTKRPMALLEIGMGVEGGSLDLFLPLFQHLSARTEVNHETLQIIRSPDRVSKATSPDPKRGMLTSTLR